MTKFTRQHIYDTAKELSNWGRWGKNDQLGTLNNITPEDIVNAAKLIKKGKVFALGLDLKEKIQASQRQTYSFSETNNTDDFLNRGGFNLETFVVVVNGQAENRLFLTKC